MQKILSVTVQPELTNNFRPEVSAWCSETFGSKDNDYVSWYITSNYTRGYDAEFDVVFERLQDAQWFIIKWGGVVSNIEYDGIEVYQIKEEVFNTLFE